MEFAELLRVVADEPVFETGLLLAGGVNPADVAPFLEPSAGIELLRVEHLRSMLDQAAER